ncbi:5-methylcytosine g t mismatch-specific dna [Teratosphaeria destructans]|uniref:5-methylcytosine g t mismatch-specific dna n=1 Tax=Teratosphaeria destructans TaxID=418781 RepID=A0A9W7W0L7_9PEZI|nr:5-methylcytosine g t mismatch-specific dna [Teratosphaeria destructans]
MPNFEVYPNPLDTALPQCHYTMPSREEESRRRRRKDEAGSATSRSDKHKSHKSSSSSSSKPAQKRSSSRDKDRERDRVRERDSLPRSPVSERGSSTKKKVAMVVPEMEKRPSSAYPSFSKAHSKESVAAGSLDDLRSARPHTPAATDLSDKKSDSRIPKQPVNPPPSPPLTADNPDLRRPGSSGSVRKSSDDARPQRRERRRSTESPRRTAAGVKTANSGTSLRKEAMYGQSEVSSMPGTFPDDERKTTPSSGYRRTVSTNSRPASVVTQNTESTIDSQATSVAPERKTRKSERIVPVHESSPPSATDSQPKTPVQEFAIPPMPGKTPVIDVGTLALDSPQSFGMTPIASMPPPPPPPPPMATAKEPPRVDYLLKNGGLPTAIPKRLVSAGSGVQSYNMYQSPALIQQAPIEEYSKVFSGIHKRLDDYLQVLRNNGSLAVATGYKSVARRLLDKLSQVFARDISSQRCDCVMCKTTPQPNLSDEEDSGISWGEILEFVSGRRELPQWPPFSIQPEEGLGISGATQAPMQKLDIDVPEEYRDHYIRQNQKTKRAVQSWLEMQPEFAAGPPEEADEDTLMFAMMTRLDMQQRNFFIALMHGQSTISPSRAPTPADRPNAPSTALKRARKALQRLYRLDKSPRECECAMYLLNNPHLHGMIATLAEVNEQEWDILVSGRFDGFLWSGAEAPFPASASRFASPVGSRAPSRGMNATPFSQRSTTPFSGMSGMPPSRGPTPSHPLRNVMSNETANGNYQASMFPTRGPTPSLSGLGVSPPAPVQLDEETEIAVLAEVERNLFNDMERFEDAFEILHSRAELVRQMLRERQAGLAMQNQMRRGSADDPFVRLDTPASGVTDFEESEDDGLADLASLAPDDSASQISVNRRHRKERRSRRTPAPVQEEDESAFEEESRRHVSSGRRSKY